MGRMTGTSWWRRLTGRGGEEAAARGAKPAATSRKSSGQAGGKTGGKASGKSSAKPAGRSVAKASGAQPSGRPGRRATVDTARPVLGAVATRDGWVGALLDASGHGTPAVGSARTLTDLVDRLGADVTVLAIDVPVGLPDDAAREADRQTRALLGPQGSSVFTTPVREAVYAATYGEANTVNREKVGSGVSRQAYELRRQIMEVDAHVRADLPYLLVETHPEAGFAELAGSPVASRRRSAAGADERRALLAAAGLHAPTTAPTGVATEDLLAACAAAWTAHRVKTGAARTLPEQAQTFSDGLPAAIHL